MHLHLHLNDCILDYGPVYSFWCFAFERYNGMLGSYPTNSRQIEPQIMKKFVQQQQIHAVQIPQQCSSFSQALLKDTHWTGSLLQSVSPQSNSVLRILNLSQYDIGSCDYRVSQEDNIDFIPPIKQYVLSCDEIENLQVMYKMLYPALHIPRVCYKLQKVSVCGEMISSSSAQGNTYRNSCVSALWKQYIIRHSMTTSEGELQHAIAVVHWFKKHPQEMYFGSSSYVVCSDVERGNSICYIPVQRLLSRCCFGSVSIDSPAGQEQVIVAIPIPFKFCA